MFFKEFRDAIKNASERERREIIKFFSKIILSFFLFIAVLVVGLKLSHELGLLLNYKDSQTVGIIFLGGLFFWMILHLTNATTSFSSEESKSEASKDILFLACFLLITFGLIGVYIDYQGEAAIRGFSTYFLAQFSYEALGIGLTILLFDLTLHKYKK